MPGAHLDRDELALLTVAQPWNGNICHTLLYTIHSADQTAGKIGPLGERHRSFSVSQASATASGCKKFSRRSLTLLLVSPMGIVQLMAERNLPPLTIEPSVGNTSSSHDIVAMPSEEEMVAYIYAHPNTTQCAIAFDVEGSNVVGYRLYYNTTELLSDESMLV